MTILHISAPNSSVQASDIAILFGQEAIGGILLGLFLGWLGYKLLITIDHYQVEVLITIAIVMGGYTLAHYIHVSDHWQWLLQVLLQAIMAKHLACLQLPQSILINFGS
jgi:CPA1 family monovalent cation:H+ antiporter